MGATEIDVISTSPAHQVSSYQSHNVIYSLLTVIGVLLDEVMDTDLLLGTLLAQYDDIPIRLLFPDKGLSSGLDFAQDKVKLNRQIGYDAAKSLDW